MLKKSTFWIIRGIIFLFILPAFSLAQEEPLQVRGAQKEVVLNGYTRSDTAITVAAEVSGKVIRVNYDVGDTIEEKPFFEIDPTFIDFQIRNTRQSIKKLAAAKKKNESRTAYLKKEYDRFYQLHKGDRATEVKLDSAKEEWDQSILEQDTLDAERAALEITLAELLERKKRHNIHAPVGWVVVEKMVEAGEVITPNNPLAKVADFRKLTVPLSVSGEELAAIRSLSKVFEAELEGEPVKAKLKWVNPEFDEKTRKLMAELLLVDYEGERRGGLRFRLPLQIEAEGYWIPKAAVISRYDNPRVSLKETGETINIMVLGESNGHLIVADHPKLSPGTALASP